MTKRTAHTHASYFCRVCDKQFRTRPGGTKHVMRVHDSYADIDEIYAMRPCRNDDPGGRACRFRGKLFFGTDIAAPEGV